MEGKKSLLYLPTVSPSCDRVCIPLELFLFILPVFHMSLFLSLVFHSFSSQAAFLFSPFFYPIFLFNFLVLSLISCLFSEKIH